MKFLGVYFAPSLNFRTHVEKILAKLSRALVTLKMAKNILDSKALKLLYSHSFIAFLFREL
jgi:hypothetical protein